MIRGLVNKIPDLRYACPGCEKKMVNIMTNIKLKIRKGDEVIVLTGKDKGKKGASIEKGKSP